MVTLIKFIVVLIVLLALSYVAYKLGKKEGIRVTHESLDESYRKRIADDKAAAFSDGYKKAERNTADYIKNLKQFTDNLIVIFANTVYKLRPEFKIKKSNTHNQTVVTIKLNDDFLFYGLSNDEFFDKLKCETNNAYAHTIATNSVCSKKYIESKY